jgi:uncharacterized membrane protein YgcG
MPAIIEWFEDHPYESVGIAVGVVALYWLFSGGAHSAPSGVPLSPAQALQSQRIAANEAETLARIQASPGLAQARYAAQTNAAQARLTAEGIRSQASTQNQANKWQYLLGKLGMQNSFAQAKLQYKRIQPYSPAWYAADQALTSLADNYALQLDSVQSQAGQSPYQAPAYQYPPVTSNPYFWGSLPASIGAVGSFFSGLGGGSSSVDYGGGGGSYGGGSDYGSSYGGG